MSITSYCKTGGKIASIFLVLAIFSIYFIDKPLALFIHANGFDQWKMLDYITEEGIATLTLFCFILLCVFPTHKSIWQRVLFLIYTVIAAYIAIWIRRKLGVVCGRSWPQPWAGAGVYGTLIGSNHDNFHFFQSSTWKGSFPSGHSTETTYICCTMSLIYNRRKYIWSIPVVLMVTSLVLLNYHYLGDCLAGIALGVFVSHYGLAGYEWMTRLSINQYKKTREQFVQLIDKSAK